MEPTKEQMYRWYVKERLSYRQIMNKIGTKNNRKIKKYLDLYEIPPRERSESIKTQWENNEKRRKQQGEVFKKAHSGKKSPRRKTLKEIQKRFENFGLDITDRQVVEGYSIVYYICKKCGHEGKKSLGNMSKGCPTCSLVKRTEKSKVPFNEVQKLFDEMGLVLLSSEYINVSSPLEYLCKEHTSHGVQTISYEKLKSRKNENKKGCYYCRHELQRNDDKPTRFNAMYRKWRDDVFIRDEYICQCCGHEKGRTLRAHHIYNYSDNENLRFELKNGITLCKNCHDPQIKGSFHHVYGTRNNGRFQLEEYIKNHKKHQQQNKQSY